MANRVSIALALLLAALLTHGIVYSVESGRMESSLRMPVGTYQGFFAGVLVKTWNTWSRAHGLEPMSILSASMETHSVNGIRRVEQFSRFYSRSVFLICPLLGFGLFWLASRRKIGLQVWKPLAIAILFSTPLQALISDVVFRSLGVSRPMAEAGRAMVVLLLMMWSIGGIRIPTGRQRAVTESVTA
jgi:hypothetical protein